MDNHDPGEILDGEAAALHEMLASEGWAFLAKRAQKNIGAYQHKIEDAGCDLAETNFYRGLLKGIRTMLHAPTLAIEDARRKTAKK